MSLKNCIKFRYNECEREGIHMARSNPRNNTTQLHPEFNQQQKKKQNFQKRQRKILRNRLFVLFGGFFLIIGFLAFTYHEQQQKLAEKEQERIEMNEKLEAKKEENQDLQTQIKRLNDDEYIAQLAREKLFFSKKGEVIFSLPKQGENDKEKADSEN
ncbi:FtsB family cell division protein [Kurthia massiliensis]|uniref:FtsB family cell division protein n=1 Tax=Kurthia massiliensis TaxID=1033739 RepID=UPI001EF050D9|nr:septum formation initiator family protein [Kurthia massiliensis]